MDGFSIGGLKEKLLVAVRGGIKEVIIPSENKKDLAEITENEILKNIEIHFVDNANEIIKKALLQKSHLLKISERKNFKISRKLFQKKVRSPIKNMFDYVYTNQ